MKLEKQISLSRLTTLGIGGNARQVVTLDASELRRAWEIFRNENIFVLGQGSNVLALDCGFQGTILRFTDDPTPINFSGCINAGVLWDRVVQDSLSQGFSGLELLSGIPGTLGAAPVQNIGAYGQDLRNVIARVTIFDWENGQSFELSGSDCAWGYRTSVFKTKPQWIITGVCLKLGRSEYSEPIRYPELASQLGLGPGTSQIFVTSQVREAVFKLRAKKGMVLDPSDPDTRSAGSFFKNPTLNSEAQARVAAITGEIVPVFQSRVPAAWLIERAGFKRGHVHGRVGISSKHVLALVNRGSGSSRELLELSEAIQSAVAGKFDVKLELEPVVLGEGLPLAFLSSD